MAIGWESLPLGFRFRPTDQELVNHYLKGKIEGRMESDEVIPEIDLCKCEPWDLPDKSLIRSDDPEWFFFSPKGRKYPNGPRANRATEAGYWKATGKDRTIKARQPQPTVIGRKKTLVFYRGRAPKAVRTNWIMHEYRTAESELDSGEQSDYVLYRLFKKPEENCQSSNADETNRNLHELGNSRISLTSTGFSPVENQNGADISKDFATTLNPKLSESELQENLQNLPDSVYQTTDTDTLLADKGDSARMFPVKPGENFCNSMTYNIGDPEEDVAEQDGCHLDELVQLLGSEYAQVGSYEFPHIESPVQDYMWYPSYDVVEQGLGADLTQHNTLPQDSVTEFLDAVLSNEDVDSHGVLNNQTDVVSTALPEGRPCIIVDTSIKDSELGGDIDVESLIASYGDNVFFRESMEDSCHHETTRQLEFVGTGNSNNFSGSMEESTSQLNSDRRIIEIRRQERLPAIDNFVAQQGSAVRRLRLQKFVQMGTESIEDYSSSKEEDDEGEECVDIGNAEERKFSGLPLDTVEGICSHDGAILPASSESSSECKPTLRLRRNKLARVDEVKCSSSQLGKPRSPSATIIGMGVLLLAILLFLCLGIGWYISSRYAI
ncbi:uncharacterized protein [Typha latifolia]|uniref:uncharacterized protein n=1 Tax=Typha latifolia TaxID=4733 RepID=UPI003C2CFACF